MCFQITSTIITEKETIKAKGNVILLPAASDRIGESSGEIRTRQRLGGLLKFYH
jgi:hypothetical protein